ncbi:glycosyltransferase family 2 protein [Gillisia limnaea]|uniref:Glycosyl transferase family 2 n=1 Tax=Gillisia limnaea (strain DSM 15749 / LMG 21470 / R-8282) TaxID=865937 RepID=H2BRS4_GILLR|nr:glycosyltransferase family A protein [Gillisia limnaea]EHQ01389.1 glycosyl transferase family 2 [Gillisia limnaea DSM 15749]
MKSSGKLISIIIPTYNRSGSILKAIKSVIDQTSDSWELIIVDDGSDDDTYEVIKTFLDHPKVQYSFQENKGVSSARNYGASKAIGEFLMFLDSDDYIFPGLISEIQDLYLNEYDLICWEVLKTINGVQSLWKIQQLDIMYKNLKLNLLAGSVAYRKSIFYAVGGYDEYIKFGENYELGLRICSIEKLRIGLIEKPLSGYLLDSNLRTSDSARNKLFSYFHQYRKHLDKYNSHPSQHSQLLYMIGYNFEKINKRRSALVLYTKSWQTYPLKIKALLRIIYLKILV